MTQHVDLGTEGGISEELKDIIETDEISDELETRDELETGNNLAEDTHQPNRHKKRQYKAKTIAKTFEEEVESQLTAKRQEAQTSPRKALVEARIDSIARDLHRLRNLGYAGYPPSPS